MKGEGFGNRGLLIASIIFVLIIGAIFFAISGGLFGGTKNLPSNTPEVTDVFDGRSVRMTVEGPIVADSDHESYQIEVGIDTTSITAFTSYEKNLAAANNYNNNRKAYTDFVYALSRAGFDKSRTVSDAAADPRGVCPSGRRYTFELLDNGRELSSKWTSSCNVKNGTLVADPTILKGLFDRQISDRTATLKSIKLR